MRQALDFREKLLSADGCGFHCTVTADCEPVVYEFEMDCEYQKGVGSFALSAPQELAGIVRRSASILEVQADDEGILEIASRSRGTPRIANRMLKRVRDYAQVRGGGMITREVAREALSLLDVDELGLDKTDRAMLSTMMDKFGGGPVGLDTLAATTGEDAITIEDVYEPYLMQLGFLMRTPRGRICTPAAWEHMHRTMPSGSALVNQIEGQTRLDL